MRIVRREARTWLAWPVMPRSFQLPRLSSAFTAVVTLTKVGPSFTAIRITPDAARPVSRMSETVTRLL